MANTYKNILIVPNIGAATGTDPYISFRGGNATVNTEITLKVYPDSNGTLSFEGNTGQLFSITNDLTGSIFSVNDISGIPSIDVNANGEVRLAQFDGNVLIGSTNSDGSALLTMNGAANITSLRIRTYGEVINSSGVWTGPVIPAGKANVSVYANSGSTVTASGVNFVNTSSVTVSVTSGSSGNANIAFTSSSNNALVLANNDTTSTLLYPIMVGSIDVDSAAKVTTSKLYFNASSGQLNATIFNSLSDERDKKNVIVIYNALETVNKLVGVEYNWNDTDKKGSGLIAQRVEEVIPHLVHTNDDGVKSLNYDGLIAYLVEAIKELSRKLEDK